MEERMLKWFDYLHLPVHLQTVSGLFAGIAVNLCNQLPPSAERTVALRKTPSLQIWGRRFESCSGLYEALTLRGGAKPI